MAPRRRAARRLARDEELVHVRQLDVVAYGENHALVAADEDALATALDLFDRVDEANAHGKRALDLATALLGADHATTRAYAESWGAEEG